MWIENRLTGQHPFVNHTFERRLHRRTNRRLRERGITVEVLNAPATPCVIAATHPTRRDTDFFRVLNKTYTVVGGGGALDRTGNPYVDRILALAISHMLPVSKGDPDINRKTYEHAGRLVSNGNQVIIVPSGTYNLSNRIPLVDEVRLGGTLSIVKHSGVTEIHPLLTYVDGDIDDRGNATPGSRIVLGFSNQTIDVSPYELAPGRFDDRAIATELVGKWEEVQAELMSSL